MLTQTIDIKIVVFIKINYRVKTKSCLLKKRTYFTGRPNNTYLIRPNKIV